MATGPRIQYEISATTTGAAEVEKLATELEKLDNAVDPSLAKKARDAAAALRSIGQQQEAINEFVRWKTATGDARDELDRAQAAAQKLATEIAKAGEPTKAQVGQMQKLSDAVRDAKQELQQQTASLDNARSGLTQLGIPLDGVAAKQRELKKATADVRQEVEALATTARSASGFSALVQDTDAARLKMEAAANSVNAYARALGTAGPPTAAQASELTKLQQAAAQAAAEFERLQAETVQQATALRQAGANTEQLTSQARELAGAQRQAGAAAQQFGAQSAAASAQAQRAHEGVRTGIDSIGDSLRTVKGVAAAAIGGDLLAGTVGDVLKTADAYSNLAARIKLVTGEGDAFKQSFQGVFEVAQKTSTSLESTGTLFARIAMAGKDMGVSNQQALQLTESINQAVQLSGASAQASDAAVTQLIQGLQSGVLRGEEFNSVMEQAPRLAQALAAGLNVPIGKLREMAGEGKLTTTAVIQALRTQRETLEREFGSLPATVGRAITNLQTEWTKFIGTTSESSGATALVAKGIDTLAQNLQNVADVAGRAGAVLTAALAVQGVAALRAFVAEGRAATLASTALSASLGSIPKVISITVAAAGFEIGFRIGEMLRENSELARKLGVGVAGFLQATLSDLQLLMEGIRAIFTDDAIEDAFLRYKKRAADLDESFNLLWEGAEEGPKKSTDAMNAASLAAEGVGNEARTTAQSVSSIAPAGAAAAASMEKLGAQAKVSLPEARDKAQQLVDKLKEIGKKGGESKDVFEKDIPGAVEKMDGQALNAFFKVLSGAMQDTNREAQLLGEKMQGAGGAGEEALAKSQQAARQLADAMALVGAKAASGLGVDTEALSGRLSKPFTDSQEKLSVLIGSLPVLQAAGVDTGAVVGQALGGMIQGAKNQAEIDAVVGRINSMGQAGVLSGEQVSGALQAAADKSVELRAKIEDATPGVNSLGEAARRAGVDFDLLSKGVSKPFADSVTQVRDLANQIEATGTMASTAGPVLAQALNQRIATAQTTEEAKLLEAEIQRITAQSPQLGAALSGALDAAKQKAAELSPAMKQLQDDAQLLGVNLSKGMDAGAGATTQLIEAYERLKASGRTTADELEKGFMVMATKVIAASGGVVPEWLKVEAGLRGIQLQAGGTGSALQGVGTSGVQAGQQMVDGFEEVRKAGIGVIDTLKEIRERNEQIKPVTGSNRQQRLAGQNAIDAGGLMVLRQKLDAGTLSEDDRATAQALADAAKQNAVLSADARRGSAGSIGMNNLRSIDEQASIASRVLEHLNGQMKERAKPPEPAAAPTAAPPADQTHLPGGGARKATSAGDGYVVFEDGSVGRRSDFGTGISSSKRSDQLLTEVAQALGGSFNKTDAAAGVLSYQGTQQAVQLGNAEIIDQLVARLRAQVPALAPAPAAPAAAPGAATKTVVINLYMNGQLSTSGAVNTDDNGADALLRVLETAGRSSR